MAQRPHAQPAIDDGMVEQIEAGCPMLVRAATPHPLKPDEIYMRCALGWSVYSRLSQARCAATHAVEDCWQEHPEKTPMVEVDSLLFPRRPAAGKVAAD